MRRSVRAWVVAAALIVAWAVLGYFFDTSPHLGWLPKGVLTASVVAPAAWIAIYTAQGLAGAGKWWRSDLGVNLVWMMVAVLFGDGMIAWAQFFNHGLLDTPTQAWLYLGGKLAQIVIITWRSVIWVRNYRQEPPLLARVRELEAEVARLRERPGGTT